MSQCPVQDTAHDETCSRTHPYVETHVALNLKHCFVGLHTELQPMNMNERVCSCVYIHVHVFLCMGACGEITTQSF